MLPCAGTKVTATRSITTAVWIARHGRSADLRYGGCRASGIRERRGRRHGDAARHAHAYRVGPAAGRADAIRADAEQAEHVVLIGGSYIACELAATLKSMPYRLDDLAERIEGKKVAFLVANEGVEQVEELKTLQKIGITFAQGYYFARPEKVPPAAIDAANKQRERYLDAADLQSYLRNGSPLIIAGLSAAAGNSAQLGGRLQAGYQW